MWNVQGKICLGCGLFRIWDVPDVRCSEGQVFGIWDLCNM